MCVIKINQKYNFMHWIQDQFVKAEKRFPKNDFFTKQKEVFLRKISGKSFLCVHTQ